MGSMLHENHALHDQRGVCKAQVPDTRGNSVQSICIGLQVQTGYVVQELCESRGGRPGLSVLTSLLVSVDVKIY